MKILGYVNLYDSPALGDLTKNRTPGSTSFVGRFALIDFALSNFANSNINNINVLVKDSFRSVAKHCGSLKTWTTNHKTGKQNYLINERGIADKKFNSDVNAIRENDWVLFDTSPDYIVIQPAHIITKINIKDLVDYHVKSGADITMAYTSIKNGNEAFLSSTVLKFKDGRIVSSVPNKGSKKNIDVSLRTYVFSKDVFDKIIHHRDYRNALSLRMLISHLINEKKLNIVGYKYEGYARCFDSLKHFMEYSFELLDIDLASSLFAADDGIYTITRNTPPAIYGEKAQVKDSFIANGTNINGKVEHSIISRYVVIENGASVRNSIILTRTVVKKGAVIENAVIDKYAVISGEIKGTKENPIYIKQGSKK